MYCNHHFHCANFHKIVSYFIELYYYTSVSTKLFRNPMVNLTRSILKPFHYRPLDPSGIQHLLQHNTSSFLISVSCNKPKGLHFLCDISMGIDSIYYETLFPADCVFNELDTRTWMTSTNHWKTSVFTTTASAAGLGGGGIKNSVLNKFWISQCHAVFHFPQKQILTRLKLELPPLNIGMTCPCVYLFKVFSLFHCLCTYFHKTEKKNSWRRQYFASNRFDSNGFGIGGLSATYLPWTVDTLRYQSLCFTRLNNGLKLLIWMYVPLCVRPRRDSLVREKC